MGLSLRNIGKKVFDQINPLDNGRTYQNSTPTNTRSILGQVAHNGTTNTVGNFLVKPIANTTISPVIETGRMITAEATHNIAAQNASRSRIWNDIKGSIPGQVAQAGYNIGSIPGDLTAATLYDLQGKHELAGYARDNALGHIHEVPGVGAATDPAARDLATYQSMRDGPADINAQKAIAGKQLESIGIDPTASFGKQLTDAAGSVIALDGLMKGLDKGGAKWRAANEAKNLAMANEAETARIGNRPTVTQKVPLEAPVDNTPAYLRNPKPTAQELYQQASSEARASASEPGKTYAAGLDPNNPLDVPSFQRQGIPTSAESATNLAAELARQKIATIVPHDPAQLNTPPQVAGLLEAPKDGIHGQGFTMNSQPNLNAIEAGKTVAKIDKVLDTVRQGKSKLTADAVRELVKKRQDVLDTMNAPTKPNVKLKVAKAEKPKPLTVTPEKPSVQLKVKNVPKVEVPAEPPTVTDTGKPAVTAKTVPLADLPEIVKQTGVPNTPSAIQRAYLSVRGVLDKMGTGGKEVARRLEEHRAQSEMGQQDFLNKIPSVVSLSEKDFGTFVDSLKQLSKGETPNLSPKIAQAVNEWSQNIQEVQKRAVAAGLPTGDQGQYYFPQTYPDLFKGGSAFNRLAQSLVDSGQAKDIGDAIKKLDFAKSDVSRTFGSLDKAREFDLPGYDKSKGALTNYIARSFDRITKAEQFGPNGEVANQLLGRMTEEGYDAGVGKKSLATALGNNDYNHTAETLSGGARQLQAYSKLGTAGITNAGQSVNTVAMTGIRNTLKSVIHLVDPKERALVQDSGVLLDHTISKLQEGGLGVRGKIASNIASPGFGIVERFNRLLAGEAGKTWADSLAKKAAAGDEKAASILRDKLGVTGEIGEKLTREQQLRAARAVVDKTQFKVDPQDLPGWVDTPGGKLVAQFKQFGYKQTGFIANELIGEALKGNPKPLARFLLVGIPTGIGELKLKGLIKGNDPFTNQQTGQKDSQAQQIYKGFDAIGGTGLAGQGKFLVDNRASDRLPQYVAGAVGGPTAGTAVETTTNVAKAFKGDTTALKRQGAAMVPVVGTRVANAVAPYKNTGSPTGEVAPGKTPTNADLQKQTATRLKELRDNVAPNDNGLEKLPNGKFAATINGEIKTFDKLEAARDASRKDHALDDGSNSKTLDGKYYYKDENGDTKVMPKYKHDFDVADSQNQLDLYKAKDSDDLQAWGEAADKQLTTLTKLRDSYNQDSQQDKVDDVQKKIETLKSEATKYAGYGGFTKPKVGSAADLNPYKYAVSRNAGGSVAAPRVSVKQGKRFTVTSKSGGSRKASVSIKKSRV